MNQKIYKNWKQLTAIFVGLGILGMSFGTFTPTVLGGVSGAPCDLGEGEISHWDKIIFSSPSAIKAVDESIIPKNEMLSIVVPTSTSHLADLRQEVVDWLNGNGYTRPSGDPFAKHLVVILDDEYAIGCISFGSQPA